MSSKSYPVQESCGGPDREQGKRISIQKQLDSLLLRLQPTPVADDRRRTVLEYVQEAVQRQVPGCKIFPVGSFPLKTYLPCADVDMVMFSPRSGSSTGSVGNSPGEVGAGSSGKGREGSHDLEKKTDNHPGGDAEIADAVRPPALVAVNSALCSMAALAGSRRGPRPPNGPWPSHGQIEPEIRNVSFINARTPIVTMVVGNVVVDLTENQGGSVAASALLEEADNLIQRDHLFKRSLLILKAWAWCETPRLVGKRVLGAQKGGLTSYGLSVMVLHLFASEASADELVHPLDVFIRFFEVYSDFDWGRYCITLNEPLPFGSVRQPHPGGGSGSESAKTSRLRPLVRKVLAELSPGAEKENEQEKAARRGRRASRSGRSFDGRGEDSSASGAGASGSSGASPHFPRRDCNIQDPLNALNNLGHSVTKENLKALQRALRRGRQQLEAWQLLPRPVRHNSPPIDGPLRRPRETGVAQTKQSPGGRSSEERCDHGRSEPGPAAEDPRVGNGERFSSTQASPPAVEQFNSARGVHQFGPPAQYVGLPPPQAAYMGVGTNNGHPHPVWIPGPQGQPIVRSFPQPFSQVAPHQYQIAHQPQPYMVPQRQPGMQRPYSASLVPAPGIQAHPNFSSQFQLQRVLPVTYQGDHQLGSDHRMFARMNVIPAGWRGQATAHSEVHVADPKLEEKHKSAPRADKSEGSIAENGSCEGRRRKRPEEVRDPAMQSTMSPWDLGSFVNTSATPSTASMSDVMDYGSKDGQDFQFQSDSGADDEVHEGPAKETTFMSSCDESDLSEMTVDTRHGGGGDGPMEMTSGKLWANSFLREIFPECCHRYGSGDGFREDLLDHPCQRRSRMQEPGAPSPRPHGAPNVLQGDSRKLWNSLTTVGEMVRETGPPSSRRIVKEAEPTLEYGREVEGADRDGQAGQSGADDKSAHVGHQAEVERRATQIELIDVVAPAYGGGRPSPPTIKGGDAPGEDVLPPTWKTGEEDGGGRPQRGGRDGIKTNKVSIDDEAGYTSEDATSSSARSVSPVESPSPTDRSLVSASAQMMATDRSLASASAQTVSTDRSLASSSAQTMATDRSLASASAQTVSTDRSLVSTSSQTVVTDRSLASASAQTIATDRSLVSTSAQTVATDRSLVSASAQTMDSVYAGKAKVDVGMQFGPEVVDRGVQCFAPVSRLMVSSASQCEKPTRMSTSVGVQCCTPAPTSSMSRGTPWSSIGIQCCLPVEEVVADKTPSAPPSPSSTRAGCLPVEEVAADKTPSAPPLPSSMRAGVGANGSLPDSSKNEGEEACDSSGACRNVLRSDTTQSVPDAAGPITPCSGARLDERGPASKNKKKRKKARATAVAARTAASEDAGDWSSEGSTKAISVRPGGWIKLGMKGVVFWGVAVVVLVTVWGARWRAGEASGKGGGLLTLRGVHKGHEERAQPPVWVKVGGSFTLGDVLTPRRSATEEGGPGEVQWFKGGRAIPGETRPFFTIPAARLEDEGAYACYTVEESGRIGSRPLWEEVTVRVSNPPIVESQLQTQRLARGEMLAIVATASGVPRPEFQWRRNGVAIPGANRPMLVKHFVSEDDMGTYTCDVYNVAGSVQWEEMAVTMREDGPE